MRSQKNRLRRVNHTIESAPVTSEAASTALDVFRQTGELPDHKRLASRVTEDALRLPHAVSMREMLLREATHDFEPVQRAARTAIRLLVESGRDVTSRHFLNEDMPLPTLGSIGLHLLGWPDILIRPPYEKQAKRVIERAEQLRPWLNAEATRTRRLATFAATFFKTGDLPIDERMRDAVLTYAEFLALHKVLGDGPDEEVLSAFDTATQPSNPINAEAVVQLKRLAAAGRIP